jgi:hypothetical protein
MPFSFSFHYLNLKIILALFIYVNKYSLKLDFIKMNIKSFLFCK